MLLSKSKESHLYWLHCIKRAYTANGWCNVSNVQCRPDLEAMPKGLLQFWVEQDGQYWCKLTPAGEEMLAKNPQQ